MRMACEITLFTTCFSVTCVLFSLHCRHAFSPLLSSTYELHIRTPAWSDRQGTTLYLHKRFNYDHSRGAAQSDAEQISLTQSTSRSKVQTLIPAILVSLTDSPRHLLPHAMAAAAAPASVSTPAGDIEIQRRSRLGLEITKSYDADNTGWKTLRITKPDGTGSIHLKDAHAEFDWAAFGTTADDTIVVQTKTVPDPVLDLPVAGAKEVKGTRPIWRSASVLPFPPSDLLRLFYDFNHQCEWNKSLFESRVYHHVGNTVVGYVVSAPAVGGAISSREFVDARDFEFPPPRIVEGRAHQDIFFAGVGVEPDVLPVPHHAKYVRGFKGPGGFVLRSIDPPAEVLAADPEARWCLASMLLDTDARGWIPKSLVHGGMPPAMYDFQHNLSKSMKERKEKGIPLGPMPVVV